MERQAKLTFSTKCKDPCLERGIVPNLLKIDANLNRMNVQTGPPEDKTLATGLHRVRDIYCKQCL